SMKSYRPMTRRCVSRTSPKRGRYSAGSQRCSFARALSARSNEPGAKRWSASVPNHAYERPRDQMPPTDRFVISFAAEPPQQSLPYGRWAELLREHFVAACEDIDSEGE